MPCRGSAGAVHGQLRPRRQPGGRDGPAGVHMCAPRGLVLSGPDLRYRVARTCPRIHEGGGYGRSNIVEIAGQNHTETSRGRAVALAPRQGAEQNPASEGVGLRDGAARGVAARGGVSWDAYPPLPKTSVQTTLPNNPPIGKTLGETSSE